MLLIVGGTIFGIIMLYKRSEKFAALRRPHAAEAAGRRHRSCASRRSRASRARSASRSAPACRWSRRSIRSANATGSVVYNDAVKQIREDVAVGHQLQLAMRQTNLFPNMVVQMVAIGEEAGALDKMLFKIAEFYEEEVNNAVDALSSLLEPFIMVIIGVLVGGMVIGMYLPIFKLAAVVG